MERPRPAERIVHDGERRFIPTDRHRREARVRRERLLREYRRRAAKAPLPARLALTLRLWWALAATSAPERRLHHRSGPDRTC